MTDELYMRRCLELAENGMSSASPNPMVGCVIVHQNTVIGEGFHVRPGEAHAEVNAIDDVFHRFGDKEASRLLKDATAYVSLEPCAHFGRTPPCADLLIRHQVKKVVVGSNDPFTDVNGKGIAKLRAAGINVVQGVLEQECDWLNRRFFTRVTKQRPYIILKWAQTGNGYFAPITASQRWISTPVSKKLVHKWRNEEDAVLVGKQTVIADNPQLTTREWSGKNPVRIVIDRHLTIPGSRHVFNDQARTIVLNEVKTSHEANVTYIQMEDMQFYLPQKIAYQLYLLDIQSMIIEGGANILNQFLQANLWDEARVFQSQASWETGIPAPLIHGAINEVVQLNHDKLIFYQNWQDQ